MTAPNGVIRSVGMIPFFFSEFPPLGLAANALERLDGEAKRRSNVIGIFPRNAAIVRLVGALLLDQNDRSSIQRRYISRETLAGMSDNRRLRPLAIAA